MRRTFKTDVHGFSAVESLVSMALIALALLAIFNLFPVGYSNIAYGGQQTLAASYAQQKTEQLRNLSFDAITTTTCANTSENLGNGFSRSCLLTLNAGAGSLAGDLKKVQVTVT